jgi:hypothetical protein
VLIASATPRRRIEPSRGLGRTSWANSSSWRAADACLFECSCSRVPLWWKTGKRKSQIGLDLLSAELDWKPIRTKRKFHFGKGGQQPTFFFFLNKGRYIDIKGHGTSLHGSQEKSKKDRCLVAQHYKKAI